MPGSGCPRGLRRVAGLEGGVDPGGRMTSGGSGFSLCPVIVHQGWMEPSGKLEASTSPVCLLAPGRM